MDIYNLSPFVSSQFKQNTELSQLLSSDFDLPADWLNYQQHTYLDLFSLLRKYRKSRLALIASRDLLKQQHLETLKQVSALARLMIVAAYKAACTEIMDKFGTVHNNKGQAQSFIIFALGKLGGNELNYSSDVDLVFCYSGPGQADGKKSLDAQDYFTRLGRRIIQILDSFTSDGIVYRVDMRLRPFGSAAPLVCSTNNLLDYLEHEGRDWERYAWLRASYVAGDQQLAQSTLENIKPFIYRKYLDYSIFASLRQIKAQISRSQQHDLDNLKLGTGGIREIEFIIQTLQLTFAGRNKQLQGNDLWLQMHKLQQFGHLSAKELQQLSQAWLFLRQLENLCQIINDRAAHHLPADGSQALAALAQCMGFAHANALKKQLKKHREQVHAIFEQQFLSSNKPTAQIHPHIQQLKDEIANKKFPKASKHKIYAALDALSPLLLKQRNQALIIQRYQQVINAVSKRPNYLSMLTESALILEKLVQQISYSDYFCKAIANNPALLELLFDGVDHSDFEIKQQWRLFSSKYSIDDDEDYLDLLCQFKQRIQFKIVLAYIDEYISAQVACKSLSILAQHLLKLVIKLAWQQSQDRIASSIQVHDLIVIAYGSMATQSMHLQSDFDLVFIINQRISNDNHKFIMYWIKRIIYLLSIRTYSGHLYKLDTQLRPNGNSGAAVVSRTNFENYQRNDAWLWEHAALIKSRTVYATEAQTHWYTQLRKEILCRNRTAQSVDQDLQLMADKLQEYNPKGNHQQEFLVLGKILKEAHNKPELIAETPIDKRAVKHKLDQSIQA